MLVSDFHIFFETRHILGLLNKDNKLQRKKNKNIDLRRKIKVSKN
jgi:hypothetical protein